MRKGQAQPEINHDRSGFREPRSLPLLTSQIDIRKWLDPSIRPASELEATRELDRIFHEKDNTPHLWSIGPDQTDDQGWPQQRKSNHTKGDLVWMLTPIPGLGEDEWRKTLRDW
jgi:hypothetical protein